MAIFSDIGWRIENIFFDAFQIIVVLQQKMPIFGKNWMQDISTPKKIAYSIFWYNSIGHRSIMYAKNEKNSTSPTKKNLNLNLGCHGVWKI